MQAALTQKPARSVSSDRGAVIIVVHGTGSDLKACLDSLCAELPENVATIVVDNASPLEIAPAFAPLFPGTHFLRTTENLGYAGGNNAGAAYAFTIGAPLLYFLNDDTVVTPGFWEGCEQSIQEHGASIAGSVLVRFDRPGVMELAGWDLDRTTLTESFRGPNENYGPRFAGHHPCDAVLGAGFMMRADLFHALGGFDRSYFHLAEEIDLCLRARHRGAVVTCAGPSIVRHKGGMSLGHQKPRYVFFLFRNKIWLWRRHVNLKTFLRYAPRRTARLLLSLMSGGDWRPTAASVLAAWAGVFAGFFWRRARRLEHFPAR